jgi:hypothetical protein
MNADIKGALKNINKCWPMFEHDGMPMSKKEVEAVLHYGLGRGYDSTNQISDEEVNLVLKTIRK